MVAEAAYQEYEEPDNSRNMAKHEHMKAPERIIQQQSALSMGMRMFSEEKDGSSLAKKATAAYEDRSNGKYISSP